MTINSLNFGQKFYVPINLLLTLKMYYYEKNITCFLCCL